MHLGLTRYWQIALTFGLVFSTAANAQESYGASKTPRNKFSTSALNKTFQNPGLRADRLIPNNSTIATLAVIPETVDLVKDFEGFRSYS